MDTEKLLDVLGDNNTIGENDIEDLETGIPHFESKYLVEKHVAGLGIPYTISAPSSVA